jgi:hypothetical protein
MHLVYITMSLALRTVQITYLMLPRVILVEECVVVALGTILEKRRQFALDTDKSHVTKLSWCIVRYVTLEK